MSIDDDGKFQESRELNREWHHVSIIKKYSVLKLAHTMYVLKVLSVSGVVNLSCQCQLCLMKTSPTSDLAVFPRLYLSSSFIIIIIVFCVFIVLILKTGT